ncbi:hypothetical protein [Paraburkholderia saeva]|uniref:hypothetical protein n=1 Tax=Paraburkholderia saeva TaxID=2777537 RepID=UPI001D334422|nr:hypothetical protein [Paraburkholderia saeva]CAG4900317.1 hypothetical protein R52603_02725 [Paraburkholderia saeva]
MSTIVKAAPATGERLILAQPRTIDTLADIQAAQADLARQARGAMHGGSFALVRTAWVLRDFFEGTDAVLFMVPGGLIVGRTIAGAEAKEHAASHARRPGLY